MLNSATDEATVAKSTKRKNNIQNQLKSNKIIFISRHVFNSERRTKRSSTFPRQIAGSGFAYKRLPNSKSTEIQQIYIHCTPRF
jgi:hypothetical protein